MLADQLDVASQMRQQLSRLYQNCHASKKPKRKFLITGQFRIASNVTSFQNKYLSCLRKRFYLKSLLAGETWENNNRHFCENCRGISPLACQLRSKINRRHYLEWWNYNPPSFFKAAKTVTILGSTNEWFRDKISLQAWARISSWPYDTLPRSLST